MTTDENQGGAEEVCTTLPRDVLAGLDALVAAQPQTASRGGGPLGQVAGDAGARRLVRVRHRPGATRAARMAAGQGLHARPLRGRRHPPGRPELGERRLIRA